MIDFTKEVEAIADRELHSANEKFPLFHSMHEGHGIIKEEFEETSDNLKSCMTDIQLLWYDTRLNDLGKGKEAAGDLYKSAISTACEAIQMAAMAKKFLLIGEKHEVPEVRKDPEES